MAIQRLRIEIAVHCLARSNENRHLTGVFYHGSAANSDARAVWGRDLESLELAERIVPPQPAQPICYSGFVNIVSIVN